MSAVIDLVSNRQGRLRRRRLCGYCRAGMRRRAMRCTYCGHRTLARRQIVVFVALLALSLILALNLVNWPSLGN